MVQHSCAAGLPQAYAAMASDDQYEATLAKADACALQCRTDTKECAPETTVIDNLPKAHAATAADDGLEDRLAHTDMKDVQARTDVADSQSPSWALGLSECYAGAAALDSLEMVLDFNDMRKLQRCTDTAEEQSWATVLPAAFSEADVEQSHKHMDSSSASPRAPELDCDEDAFDGDQSPLKRQKITGALTRQESECSTTVPDGFARQFSAPDSPTMAF